MVRGFIKPNFNVVEVIDQIESLKQNGITTENISINKSFDEFRDDITDNDTVIIISFVDIFSSLTELFATAIEFCSRNISLVSLNEPKLVINNEHIVLIESLQKIGSTLRAERTKKGLSNAVAQGKKLGRPYGSTKVNSKVLAVEKLIKTSSVSIEKACQIVGCSTKTYYRYREKKAAKNN